MPFRSAPMKQGEAFFVSSLVPFLCGLAAGGGSRSSASMANLGGGPLDLTVEPESAWSFEPDPVAENYFSSGLQRTKTCLWAGMTRNDAATPLDR